jgi:hypothetical protein
MKRALAVVGWKLLAFAVCIVVFTVVVAGAFFTVTGAAWFALGDEAPPIPWWMLRMFLFLGWVLAAFYGFSAPPPSRPTTNEGEIG